MLLRALIAVESDSLQERLSGILGEEAVHREVLNPGEDVWDRLTREDFDLVLLDRLGTGEKRCKLVEAIAKLPGRPGVIVFAPREDPRDRATLLAAGCVAVLGAGLQTDTLADALRALLHRRREEMVHRIQAERPEERFGLDGFVAVSPAMREFMATVNQVARSGSTSLLIAGETGVGKERLARAIHGEGARRSAPFVALNCGALPENLLESELFGHEEGAFTGAVRARRGYFEMAHGGTLFLDEVGEMPVHLQVKLLRALEERRFYRLGGERAIAVDVRIVAATNRDLKADVAMKRFRSDLYYRLAVVTLSIPPLRERREDIPLLVESYFNHFSAQLNRRELALEPSAVEALEQYAWPGNVRELINVVERAVLLCQSSSISVLDLPFEISRVVETTPVPSESSALAVPETWYGEPLDEGRRRLLDAFEHRYLTKLLRDTGGRVGEAARQAGVTERSLYDLMKKHRLRKEDFKSVPSA